MMPLAVIRPQPGCDATTGAARALGFEAHGFPLFAVRPVGWKAPAAETVDALLVGSANAFRHGGEALAAFRDKPVYAVGETTAAAAREAGFAIAFTGRGGLQATLAALDPAHRRLLRLAGRERVELEAPAGVIIDERVVYASEALPLPAGLAALLERPLLVLLHSAEAARHFAALYPARDQVSLACIGPRVAAAAGEGWHRVESAATPEDAALLALAARMCQDEPGFSEGHD